MRRRLMVGAALAAPLVTVMAATPCAAAAPSGRAGSYVVVLKDTASPTTLARAHASRYGAKVDHVYSHALRGYSATVPVDRVAALKADPNVAAVTPDLPVHAFAQTLPTGCDRVDGERSSTVSGSGSGAVAVDVDIAIIDTGIAPTIPASTDAPRHLTLGCRGGHLRGRGRELGRQRERLRAGPPLRGDHRLGARRLQRPAGRRPRPRPAGRMRTTPSPTSPTSAETSTSSLPGRASCRPTQAAPWRARTWPARPPSTSPPTPAQIKSALQAAGSLNWNDADDPDSAKERLLDVDAIQPCRRGAAEEWSRLVDWRATMRWQGQLGEGDVVVGAIRNPR
jgi:Peptidase inhibitor I9